MLSGILALSVRQLVLTRLGLLGWSEVMLLMFRVVLMSISTGNFSLVYEENGYTFRFEQL